MLIMKEKKNASRLTIHCPRFDPRSNNNPPRRRRHPNGRILNGSSLDFGNTSSRPVPNLSESPAVCLPQIPRSPHQIESGHHVTHSPWSFPSESELFSKVGA